MLPAFDMPFSCGGVTLLMRMTLTPELGERIRAYKQPALENEPPREELIVNAADYLTTHGYAGLLEKAALIITFDGEKRAERDFHSIRLELHEKLASGFGLPAHRATVPERYLSGDHAISYADGDRLRSLISSNSTTDLECQIMCAVAGRRNNLEAGRILFENGCLERARADYESMSSNATFPYAPFWETIEREFALNAGAHAKPSSGRKRL